MNKNVLFIFALLTILIISCTPSEPTTPPEQTTDKTIGRSQGTGKVVAVAIRGFKFVPAEVNIKVGETVVWTNEDSAPHTVESADGVLRSDELSKGDTYSYTFTSAGKHDYICGIHPTMHGSVTVQ